MKHRLFEIIINDETEKLISEGALIHTNDLVHPNFIYLKRSGAIALMLTLQSYTVRTSLLF